MKATCGQFASCSSPAGVAQAGRVSSVWSIDTLSVVITQARTNEHRTILTAEFRIADALSQNADAVVRAIVTTVVVYLTSVTEKIRGTHAFASHIVAHTAFRTFVGARLVRTI